MPNITMKNKSYDRLKFTTTIVLPALGTLYFTLAAIWGLPYAEQFVGTIAAIATFMGVILKISSDTHAKLPEVYDGALVVNDTDPEREIYRIELDTDIVELGQKTELKLRVNNPLRDASQD